MDIAGWKALNRLVEHALELTPAERTTWVEQLGPEYEAYKPRLRAMLARLDATGAEAFLDALPTWNDLDAPEVRTGFQPGALVDRYRLVRELASGGQGEVWLAERTDGLVDRPVAIKLPLVLAHRPGLAERLARERDILARLSHPHIGRLYDAGLAPDGTPFLALEYVEGVPIDQFVAPRRLDVEATLRLFLQVVDAVAYAHGQLVIHRDLKPSNVLVTNDGQARLLDFGIAKLLDEGTVRDSTVTLVGGRALTPAYASPEQIAREALGVATDVYSLGVVLFELLCGRRPHEPAAGARGAAVLDDEPPRPSAVVTDRSRRDALRGDLDTVVLKALKKRPMERYATADAFADDLRRWLDHRPVSAQPDSAAYRVAKFVRRHRAAVAAGAAVLVAIVVGTGTSLWQARAARAERDRADAVKEFVTAIFRDIDPNLRGAGRPLTAVDVLGQARERLDAPSMLETEPQVRAELRRVLGGSFLGVGDAQQAAGLLSHALPETVALSGEASPEAVGTELLLARALHLAGKTEKAHEHLDHAVGLLERSGRAGSEAAVEAALLRAEMVVNEGGYNKPEAEAAAKAALEVATRNLPPVHDKRARALGMMATVARWRNRDAEAADYAEQSFRMLVDLHRGDTGHVSVVMAENELGRSLFQTGRTSEALEHLEQAAANGNTSLADHPTLRQHLLGTLANAQLVHGDLKKAIANFEQAISLDLKGVSLSPAYVAGQQFVRARAYLAARRLTDAAAAYDIALDTFRNAGDTATIPTVMSERAEALVRLGRLEDAQGDLDVLLASRGPKLSPAVRRAVWLQGELWRRAGASARALPLLREAVDFEPNNVRNKVDRAQFQVSLGLALLDAGQLDEATRVLEAARAAFAANQGVMTPSHAESLAALARVHVAAGRREDAQPLTEQVAAFWQDFDPNHAAAHVADLAARR